jgi:mono/diheme cytochrome c family protein
MGTSINALLGGAFVLLALFLTFLMYYLWGFPFDKKKHRSSAPRSLMNLHRLFGSGVVRIYVVLMWDMVPRLWTYQVELPARTVIHLTLGICVGAILFIKIAVVRFFKHMESTLAPVLGTMLLLCTLMLTGLALPYAAREAYLRATAQDGENFSDERIARVVKFLPKIGFTDEAGLQTLATSAGLSAGRDVLTRKCTQCHDLRTILVKPRTPEAWHNTVKRMATRSTVLNPITDSEQWRVTAYLIAISPTLRKGVSDKRAETQLTSQSRSIARQSKFLTSQDYDPVTAKALFETKCAQCHSSSLIENATFSAPEDVQTLVSRMIQNGLNADESELGQITTYLAQAYSNNPN